MDKIEIAIVAVDKASGVIQGVKGALSSLAAVGVGAATAAAAGFVILAKEALGAIAEYERMTLVTESLTAREIRQRDEVVSLSDAIAVMGNQYSAADLVAEGFTYSMLTQEQALRLAGDEAQETLKWIQQIAIASPFDMLSVQTTYRQALTYGFTADEARRLTQNTLDFAAANGLTAEAMNTVSYALGQINNNDKVLMLDLRQLMQVGVPVNDILEEMGMNYEDVTDGLVKSNEFLGTFNRLMEEDFGGAAERQLSTWTGLLNTFTDIRKMGLRELFGGMFDALQPVVSKFTEWFLGDGLVKLGEWGTKLGEITQGVMNIGSAWADAGFMSIEFKEALGGLLESFGVDVAKLTPEMFLNIAGDFWVNFTAALEEGADDIDWGVVSQSIIDGLGRIDFAAQGATFAEGAGNLINAIKIAITDVISETDWGGLWEASSFSIADFIAGMFGTDKEGADEAIREQIGSWKTAFETGLNEINDTVLQTNMAKIATTIATWMTVNKSIISSSILLWPSSITTALGGVGTAFFNAGSLWGKKLYDGLKSALGMLLALARQMAMAIATALGGAIPLIGSGFGLAVTGGASGGTKGAKPKDKGLASGGPVRPGEAYTVGERGPETLVMGSRGGNIIPGGGMIVNLTYAPAFSTADKGELLSNLVPVLDEWYRRRLTS